MRKIQRHPPAIIKLYILNYVFTFANFPVAAVTWKFAICGISDLIDVLSPKIRNAALSQHHEKLPCFHRSPEGQTKVNKIK